MTNKELCDIAVKACENSYSPYSQYRVGAALLSKNGKIYTGCNIENASYSATVCAERTALFKAVSEGETQFSVIAIAAQKDGKTDSGVLPCGICLQALSEFCESDFKILTVNSADGYTEYLLKELFPNPFLLSY